MEDYGDEYRMLPFEEHQAHLRRIEHLAVIADLKPKRIAEIGCGVLPLFLDCHDFEAMTVIEPIKAFSQNAVELASGHPLASTIQIIPLFLEDAATGGEGYDLVILSALLHEVPSPQDFLKQAVRLGGSSCRYLITVPNAYSFHRQLAFRAGMIKDLVELSEQQIRLQQSRTYTLVSLREELEMAGLVPETEKDFILKPFTHHQMQKLLDYDILTIAQIHALADMTDLAPGAGSELLVIAKCR
jgi:2-polyprenyl-3-methyl-5-hydroxy-6-metoxy-1,4-benzoquinol methylase